jgi:hypothetical protein
MLRNEPVERFHLRFEQSEQAGIVTLWITVQGVEIGPAVFRDNDFIDIANTLEDAGRLACPHVNYDGSGRGELVLVIEHLGPSRCRVRALVLGTECPPAELDTEALNDLSRALEDVIRLVRSTPKTPPSFPRLVVH